MADVTNDRSPLYSKFQVTRKDNGAEYTPHVFVLDTREKSARIALKVYAYLVGAKGLTALESSLIAGLLRVERDEPFYE